MYYALKNEKNAIAEYGYTNILYLCNWKGIT